MLKENNELEYHLKSFAEKCFDEDRNFTPSESMTQIVGFYGSEEEAFSWFKFTEKQDHAFFEFVNKIKVAELMRDTDCAAKIDATAFAQKIRNSLEIAIYSEWGYDPKVEITSAERYFSVFLEMFPEAVNFEESIVEYCERSLLEDIKKAVPKVVLYKNENFEEDVECMLHKKLKYITERAKSAIPHFYLYNEATKQLFVNVCSHLEEIESKILGTYVVVTEKGFRFNCQIEKVEFRSLSEEELAQQVSKYQRADGQYVFHGAFVPQEVITNVIKDKFTILTIAVRHQVVSPEGAVFELRPYSKGPKDE